jgi:hypothetical protein
MAVGWHAGDGDANMGNEEQWLNRRAVATDGRRFLPCERTAVHVSYPWP